MKNKIKNTFNKLEVPEDRRGIIFDDVLKKARASSHKQKENHTMRNRNKWKFAVAGVSVAACVALAIAVVPMFTKAPDSPNPQVITSPSYSPAVNEPQTLSTFTLLAKTAGSEQFLTLNAMENGEKIKTTHSYPDDFFQFENGKVSGWSGIDIKVDNPDATKIIFESKVWDLDYEDSRNFVNKDNTPTWSEVGYIINSRNADSIKDFHNVSREDIISAFENIQSSGRDVIFFRQFVDRLYTKEISALIEKGEDYEAFINEKAEEPIDFSQFDYEIKVEQDTKKGSGEYLWIRIINPQNKPMPRIVSKRIEMRVGEYVLWSPDAAKTVGKSASEIDFSIFDDEITVTVEYADGKTDKQVWQITFDSEGKLSFTCLDVTGLAA